MIFLKTFGFLLVAAGAVVVYSAKILVDRYGTDVHTQSNADAVSDDFAVEVEEREKDTEKETERRQGAVIRVKIIGFAVFLAGVIIAFATAR